MQAAVIKALQKCMRTESAEELDQLLSTLQLKYTELLEQAMDALPRVLQEVLDGKLPF